MGSQPMKMQDFRAKSPLFIWSGRMGVWPLCCHFCCHGGNFKSWPTLACLIILIYLYQYDFHDFSYLCQSYFLEEMMELKINWQTQKSKNCKSGWQLFFFFFLFFSILLPVCITPYSCHSLGRGSTHLFSKSLFFKIWNVDENGWTFWL